MLFGESLPTGAFEQAQVNSEQAKVFFVLGSSLQVSPANYLPQLAKRSGAYLGICNRDETPLDRIFDLQSHEEIGKFLSGLDSRLRS